LKENLLIHVGLTVPFAGAMKPWSAGKRLVPQRFVVGFIDEEEGPPLRSAEITSETMLERASSMA
jgi:hypothetical protein